VKLVTCKIST